MTKRESGLMKKGEEEKFQVFLFQRKVNKSQKRYYFSRNLLLNKKIGISLEFAYNSENL